jgi:hypothetical protein
LLRYDLHPRRPGAGWRSILRKGVWIRGHLQDVGSVEGILFYYPHVCYEVGSCSNFKDGKYENNNVQQK